MLLTYILNVTLSGYGARHGIKYFNKSRLMREYKVNYLDNRSDFASPDYFDGMEGILKQLQNC